MTQPAIAVIPLDDRAVNYECIALLGQAAGFDILLPPKAWLGTPWRAGQVERLSSWLAEAAAAANALIVALDTLGYGGLVNSRRSTDSTERVLSRLTPLRELKAAQPQLAILAYSVLMRVTRGNDAEEEKDYWGLYGARMFRMSVIEDRVAMAVATAEEEAELARLQEEVPVALVDDYRRGRARNHAVNRAMIQWTAEGIFDYLIIPQDDTVDYGWNIAESRALRRLVQRLDAGDRVSIYPGTDETDMLLLARYTARRAGWRPKAWLRTSGSTVGEVITAYEDRPVTELVKAHLGPLGGVLVDCPHDADLLLYINAPAEIQGNGPDQYALLLGDDELDSLPEPARRAVLAYRRLPTIADTLREMHTVRRDLPEFVRSLDQALAEGRSCAVVDVAYVNAGDVALGDLLVSHGEISQLAAYAGWNTAGNALGSALAQAVIRHLQGLHGAAPEALAAHARLLFLRLVEDYSYMAHLRTQVMLEKLPLLGVQPGMSNLGEHAEPVRALVEESLRAAARDLSARCFAGRTLVAGKARLTVDSLDIAHVILPWQRLFDITLEVDIQHH